LQPPYRKSKEATENGEVTADRDTSQDPMHAYDEQTDARKHAAHAQCEEHSSNGDLRVADGRHSGVGCRCHVNTDVTVEVRGSHAVGRDRQFSVARTRALCQVRDTDATVEERRTHNGQCKHAAQALD